MPSEDLLTSAEQAILSARADAFHSALRRGLVSNWDSHLEGLEGPVRLAVLIELIILDMGHRYRHGDGLRLEDYVLRFPELGSIDDVSPKLISEEFRCRVAAGEIPDLSHYQVRFPVQFPGLRAELTAVLPLESAVPQSGPGRGPAQGTAVGGVAGEFEFLRKLGQGVFGEVWLAKKKTSGIEKAIKILLQAADHEAAIRELRSLELIKNLRHPYLLATEDFWISGDRLHVVMELAEGTLRGRLKECQAAGLPGIPEAELFRYFHEAAEGLDYLHEQKITHRDVKPDNILILRGHAKVADFGLARMQDQIMSQMSVFAGTPAYMAPEVWGGEGGPASDQYSLASTYIELRQGKSALKLGPMAEMMIAHMDGQFTFAEFIPDEEREVLRRAMAKNPGDRFENCSTFLDALAVATGRSSPRVVMSEMRGPTATPTAGTRQRSGPIPVSAARTWGSAKASGVQPPGDRDTVAPSNTGVQPKLLPKPGLRPKPKPPGFPKVAVAGFFVIGLIGVIALLVFLFTEPSGGHTSQAETVPSNTPATEATSPATRTIPTTAPEQPIARPAAAKAEPGAAVVELADGRRASQWVSLSVGPETMRFRLIPGGAPGDVKPFYLSEYKVWVGFYRAAGGAPLRETDPAHPAEAGEPLMNLTATEAFAFVRKVAPGEGALPTPGQWDHAAGLYRGSGRATLSLDGSSPVVGVAKPAATVGKTPAPDSNDFGLKDLAGNGREWTCGVFAGMGQAPRIALDGQFAPDDRVILRGRNFTLPTPLDFEKLKWDQREPQAAFAGRPSPYTGFRVVLPIP